MHHFKENYPTLFNYDIHSLNADIGMLLRAPVKSFSSMRIHLPSFQDDYIDHMVRCTGSRTFRQKESCADWVWLTPAANKAQAIRKIPGGLNGRIPAKLNYILKIRLNRGDIVYRLAHVTITTVVGMRTAAREEGMVKV